MVTLNKAQRDAVEAGDGPALVLAGAGSGKTRVIIERMAWLVEERGVDPRNLLALTFTNKAAAEMRTRFQERLGLERVATWLGTFHAFGLFVLGREIDRLGRKRSFTIFDDSDQLSLMRRLVKGLPEHLEPVSPREALTWISRLKQGVNAPSADDTDSIEELSYRELWERYHRALEAASAVDFDDLLVLLVRLFEQHPDVLAKYQRRYRYVLVDEYQDTNHAQYRIARALSREHGNLFVVGDEDQSIYSWRGADINNILDFAKDFPEAAVYRLEENYRSRSPILDASNRVVANNLNRLGKSLFTQRDGGEKVRFCLAPTAEEEARFVAKDIGERGLAPKEVAVLYRTNGQARHVEEAMRSRGLHYVVVGGIRFYDRKEIKDILSYLRLLVNPEDDESLRRILNVPPRGIGGTTLAQIEAYAVERGCTLLDVLRAMEQDQSFSTRARNSAAEFVELVDRLALSLETSKVAGLVEDLLESVGYRTHVEKSDEKDFRDRIEIVDEFVAACSQYDENAGKGLLSFLQDMALMTDVDRWNPAEPAVTLMTCHSAKGLEFPHVYLVGLEEGLFPMLREFEPDEDVEEERRLCYVAMTRARETLTLTASDSRMVYGRTHHGRDVSRFIGEIGHENLVRVGQAPAGGGKPRAAKVDSARAQSVDARQIRTGVLVRHARFGPGTVMFTQGSGDKLRARIRFKTGRTAMLLVKAAPLEILEGK